MKKYTYVVIVLMLVGSISLGCFGKMSARYWGDPKLEWEINGDESLLQNVGVAFEVSGGKAGDCWGIETSSIGSEKSEAGYSLGAYEAFSKSRKINADLNYYGKAHIVDSSSPDEYDYFEEDWKQGHWAELNNNDVDKFYKSYIEKSIENKKLNVEWEPIPLNEIMENYKLEISIDEEKSYLSIAVPEGIMVTPKTTFFSETYDGDGTVTDELFDEIIKEDGWWMGTMADPNYDFEYVKAYINHEEYLAVSFYNRGDEEDEKGFTNIYKLTEQQDKHLLKEPALVKHYDSYQPIRYMSDSYDGSAFLLLEHDEYIDICRIDKDNFEILERYTMRKYTDDYTEENGQMYMECGINNALDMRYEEEFFVFSELVRFDNNKLYLLSTDYKMKVEKLGEQYCWLELKVFEPENPEPLTCAKLKCSLFALDIKSYYSDIVMEAYYINNLRFK